MYKKITSLLLALMVAFTFAPMNTYAEGESEGDGEQTQIVEQWLVTATVEDNSAVLEWAPVDGYEPAEDLSFDIYNGDDLLVEDLEALPEEAEEDEDGYVLTDGKYSYELQDLEAGDYTIVIESSDGETGSCDSFSVEAADVPEDDSTADDTLADDIPADDSAINDPIADNLTKEEVNSAPKMLQKSGTEQPELKDISVTNVTRTSAVLTWSFVEGTEPTGEALFTILKNGEAYKTNVAEKTITVSGLVPNTNYTFAVVLQNQDPEVKKEASVTTLKQLTKITAKKSNTKYNKTTISWTLNSDYKADGKEQFVVKYYMLNSKGKRAGKILTRNVASGKKQQVISKLKEGKKYKFYVEEKTSGVASAKITVKTPKKRPGNVKGFTATSTYKGVILKWKPVKDAQGYIITWSGGGKKGSINIKGRKKTTYIDKFSDENLYTTYVYKIKAVRKKTVKSKKAAKVVGEPVRTMYYNFTFSETRQLHSYTGGNVWTTFYSGEKYVATGYEAGRYKFSYNGRTYYVNRLSTRGQSIYGGAVSERIYTTAEAESFVNRAGLSSATKYLIWANTYTQKEYIFQGSKGKWKLIKGPLPVATGAVSTPTATGLTRIKVKEWHPPHTAMYWNICSYFSIHGNIWGALGRPRSNGCIRNTDENALWIYKNCAIGTAVYVH